MGYVNVPGLGAMPEYFDVEFDGFNLEEYSNSTNSHNENNFYGRCNRDDWFNDSVRISGGITPNGYTLTFYMNSETSLPLYKDGYVTFLYDANKQLWTSMTGVTDEHLWRFCTASEVVAVVVAGLECYANSASSESDLDPKVADSLAAVAATMMYTNSYKALIESASLYMRTGCDAREVSWSEIFAKGMMEFGD